MKARQLANYVIVCTVVLCSLLLFSTLVFALTGFRWSAPGRTVEVDFRDVTGIEVGSPVRFAGKPCGRVLGIRLLSLDERRRSSDSSYVLRVTLELDESVPPLTEDVRTGIASVSFLGDKFVSLTPGSIASPPIPEGAVIQASQRGLMETVQSLGNRMDSILDKLSQDYDQLVPRVAGLVERADGLIGQGTNLLINLNSAVTNVQDLSVQLKSDYRGDYRPKLATILAQVGTISTNVNLAITGLSTNTTDTLSQVRLLVQENREDLTRAIAEFRVVAQNLKVVSTYAKILTGQLSEKPSRLIWGRKKRTLPSEDEILTNPEPVEIPLDPEAERD